MASRATNPLNPSHITYKEAAFITSKFMDILSLLFTHFYISCTERSVDYVPVSIILQFPSCETRRCVNVSIVSDLIDEPEELFTYTLERTPDLDPRITLQPVEGEIVIEEQCPGGCTGGL